MEALHILHSGLRATEFRLGGAAPTPNAFYYDPKKQVSTKLFIVASFSIVLPTDLRFDEKILTKEDYDYTLQHIEKYGGVYRRNDILPKFTHYTNAGGAVDRRTPEREDAAIEFMEAKWPGKIKRNKKRPHEILI